MTNIISVDEYKKIYSKVSSGRHLIRPRPRNHVSGEMNKLEKAYADYLELQKRSGVVMHYLYEPIKVRLAKKTFYTPDFLVVYPAYMAIHEVKGFWEDDARVKIKCAAEKMPWFEWIGVSRRTKNQGWKYEVF